jgi:hypothetical protein
MAAQLTATERDKVERQNKKASADSLCNAHYKLDRMTEILDLQGTACQDTVII